MLNASNITMQHSSLKSESNHDSCDKLQFYFNNADKHVIFVADTSVCALNILSSIIAIPFNVVILYSLFKANSLHPPSKALLSSLALSDLGVGVIVQPLYVTYRWAQIQGVLTKACTTGIVSHIGGSHFSAVSFLTMTAISVDRFLALVLRTRYHTVVTKTRVLILLLTIWILSGVWALHWLTDQRLYSLITISLMPICFLITLSSYVTIYRCLRRQTIQLKMHSKNPATSMNTSREKETDLSQIRYRRSVVSMFYLFCTLLVSFLPYLSHKISVAVLGWRTSTSVLFSFGLTLVYVNSSVNPLIYCWRIPEIRGIVTNILRSAKSSTWGALRNCNFIPKKNRVGNVTAA